MQIASQTIYFREKEAWALFADATWQATDALSIIVGGRYSKETQTNTRIVFGTAASTRKPESRPSMRADRSAKFSKFTPRASIRYEFSPRTSAYLSYSKGFKAGEWPGAFWRHCLPNGSRPGRKSSMASNWA